MSLSNKKSIKSFDTWMWIDSGKIDGNELWDELLKYSLNIWQRNQMRCGFFMMKFNIIFWNFVIFYFKNFDLIKLKFLN